MIHRSSSAEATRERPSQARSFELTLPRIEFKSSSHSFLRSQSLLRHDSVRELATSDEGVNDLWNKRVLRGGAPGTREDLYAHEGSSRPPTHDA